MQPIDPKDRPKAMLVAAAATVALGSTAWNLFRATARADSSPPDTAAMGMMPVGAPVAANSVSAPEVTSTGEMTSGAPAGSGAGAGTAVEPDADGGAAGLSAESGWYPVTDPFQPLARLEVAEGPAAAPAAPPTAPPAAPAPALPAVRVAAAEERPSTPAPPTQPPSAPASPVAAPAAPTAVESTTAPAVEPTVTVTLVGTVGHGRSALAVVRIAEETLFVRPSQVIGRWHVRRVGDGQVALSKSDKWYTAHVGETFTLGSDVAEAAPSNGKRSAT